jgi:hypothetical protein
MALSSTTSKVLTSKQAVARKSKMEEEARTMRTELWPDFPDDYFWDRKNAHGFTTMPRTMSYLINVINSLTKGSPAGMVYLTIWCRLFSVGIVKLASEKQMAFEAGFTGERAVDTWRKRMRPLKDLGFIDYKPSTDHDYQWVLVFNPHHVVQRLGKKVQERYRAAWLERATEVGAKDTQSFPRPSTPTPDPTKSRGASKKTLAQH